MPQIGRNDPCHCGSGKKYKKCHLESDEREDAKKRLKAALNIAKVADQKNGPQKSQGWFKKIKEKFPFIKKRSQI